MKDQIGSFFYFPSLSFQRAAGGFGGFIINNRPIIPIPFDTPHSDIVIFIGDWYNRNHPVSVCSGKGKVLGTNYYVRSTERNKVFSVLILDMKNKIWYNFGSIVRFDR